MKIYKNTDCLLALWARWRVRVMEGVSGYAQDNLLHRYAPLQVMVQQSQRSRGFRDESVEETVETQFQALMAYKSRWAQVLWLAYVKNGTQAEQAGHLKISLRTYKRWLSFAKAWLEERLKTVCPRFYRTVVRNQTYRHAVS